MEETEFEKQINKEITEIYDSIVSLRDTKEKYGIKDQHIRLTISLLEGIKKGIIEAKNLYSRTYLTK